MCQVGSFCPGTLVSTTNKNYCHNLTEIFFKGALDTITLTLKYIIFSIIFFSSCALEVGLNKQATLACTEIEEGKETLDFWRVMDASRNDRSLYSSLLTGN